MYSFSFGSPGTFTNIMLRSRRTVLAYLTVLNVTLQQNDSSFLKNVVPLNACLWRKWINERSKETELGLASGRCHHCAAVTIRNVIYEYMVFMRLPTTTGIPCYNALHLALFRYSALADFSF
jgi:hypothetical protein